MLVPPGPCFLVTHPNMRFRIETSDISSFCIGDADPGAFKGTFPFGRKIHMMREEFRRFNGLSDKESWFRYNCLVPPHSPALVKYGVIREVVWTRSCESSLNAFYSKKCTQEKLFEWPGAKCIGISPGTGQRVPFSTTALLVVEVLQGNVLSGETLKSITRIMPRILTYEGYERMVWPGGVKVTMKKKPVMKARVAWANFHETGYYKAFESCRNGAHGS